MTILIETILDKLMRVQEKFYGELKHIASGEGDIEGRTSILEVIGPDGGVYKLQIRKGLVAWADKDAEPTHIIRISEDAFLGVLTRETSLSECFDKREAVILDHSDERINIVELIKWKKMFERMGNILDKALK